MSLEEALAANTAAIKELTLVMRSVGNPFPPSAAPEAAAPPTKGKPGPKPKADKDTAAAGATIPETGDPVGTTYFYNVEHKTCFSRKPGETTSALAGVNITPAEFVEKTRAIAASNVGTGPMAAATAAASAVDPFAMAAAPAASADPFAMAAAPAGPPKTMEDVIAKLREVSTSVAPGRGNEGVVAGLKKFNAVNVGGLVGKNMDEVYQAFQTLLETGSI